MDQRALEADCMRDLSTFPQIFLYSKYVDFRKSINGLSEIVESELKIKPFSGAMFVFMGRSRDRIKVLYWDKSGFALWYKRLEEAKFCWKRSFEKDVITLTPEEFAWLLSGVDVWKIKTNCALNYESFS